MIVLIWIVGFCEGAWEALTERCVTRGESILAWGAFVLALLWMEQHGWCR